MRVADERILFLIVTGSSKAERIVKQSWMAVNSGRCKDRCCYGTRLPILVSPYAKRNCIDHAVNDQTSTPRFIEGQCKEGHCKEGNCNEANYYPGNFKYTRSNSGEVATVR